MSVLIVSFLAIGLILFVSFYGKGEAQEQLDEKRGWRVRNVGGAFIYEQKSADRWMSLELESIRSEEDYGIYGLRIWSAAEWRCRVPEWAAEKREIIASRVKEAFPSIRVVK
jgi:hypothetical protein